MNPDFAFYKRAYVVNSSSRPGEIKCNPKIPHKKESFWGSEMLGYIV